MAKNKGGTESIKRKIQALNNVKLQLPDQVGQIAVTFFKQNFRNQGFEDTGVQKWQPRKGQLGQGIARISKRSASGRAILVKTGALRNSIRVSFSSWRKIVIESDLPYAAIHNYGGEGNAWGKHRFKMKQRKFMGRSYALNKKVRLKIETRLNAVMKA